MSLTPERKNELLKKLEAKGIDISEFVKPDYWEAAKRGVEDSLIGTGIRYVGDKLGADLSITDKNYEPRTTGEKALGFVSSTAADWIPMMKLASLISKGAGFAKAANNLTKAGKTTALKGLQEEAVKAGFTKAEPLTRLLRKDFIKAQLPGAIKEQLAPNINKIRLLKAGNLAAEGAGIGGVYSAKDVISDATRQGEDIKPKELITETIKGATIGAPVGAALGGVGSLLGRGIKKVGEKIQGEKLFRHGEKIQPKLFSDAIKEVEGISKIQSTINKIIETEKQSSSLTNNIDKLKNKLFTINSKAGDKVVNNFEKEKSSELQGLVNQKDNLESTLAKIKNKIDIEAKKRADKQVKELEANLKLRHKEIKKVVSQIGAKKQLGDMPLLKGGEINVLNKKFDGINKELASLNTPNKDGLTKYDVMFNKHKTQVAKELGYSNIEKELNNNLKQINKTIQSGEGVNAYKTIGKSLKQELKIKQTPSIMKELYKASRRNMRINASKEDALTRLTEISNKYGVKVSDAVSHKKLDKGLNALVNIDATTPQGKKELLGVIVNKKLSSIGYDDNWIKKLTKFREDTNKFLDKNTAFNNIYETTGQDVGSHLYKGIGIKNKMSYIKKEAGVHDAEVMMEKYLNNNITNTKRLRDIIEKRVAPSTKEEQDIVAKVRDVYDKGWQYLKENYKDVGYIEGYQPLFQKYGKVTGDVITKNKSINESILKQRQLDDSLLRQLMTEDNPIKALNKYFDTIERIEVKKQVGDKLEREAYILEARGYDSYAQSVRKTVAKLLNISDDAYNKLNANDLVGKGTQYLESLSGVKIPESAIKKTYKTLVNGMYNVVIGTKPLLTLAQSYQPEIVGTAEMGRQAIRMGRKNYKSKAMQDVIKEVKSKLYPVVQDVTDIGANKPVFGGVRDKLINISNSPASLLKNIFVDRERANREIIFSGGYLKFKKLGPNDLSLYKTLDTTQKKMVRDALETGGIEEAAREYGVIMSNRVNFLYSMLNKPDVMDSAIGNIIPFTTWTRGMWNNFYSDLINKEAGSKKIAERVIPMFIISNALGILTGTDLSTLNPATGMTNVLNPSIMPFMSDWQGGLAKQPYNILKKTSPLVAILDRLKRPSPKNVLKRVAGLRDR